MLKLFSALLIIINPFGCIPLFISLTRGFDKKQRRAIILAETCCVFVLMLAFFLAGTTILSALGIGNNALLATGGLMLLKVGLQMNFPKQGGLAASFGLEGGKKPFCVPIAMPMLVGSGLIVRLIEMAKIPDQFYTHIAIIFAVTLACGIILLLSEVLLHYLGNTGLDLIERVMGLLLIMMGCQMLYSVAVFAINEGLFLFLVSSSSKI